MHCSLSVNIIIYTVNFDIVLMDVFYINDVQKCDTLVKMHESMQAAVA